ELAWVTALAVATLDAGEVACCVRAADEAIGTAPAAAAGLPRWAALRRCAAAIRADKAAGCSRAADLAGGAFVPALAAIIHIVRDADGPVKRRRAAEEAARAALGTAAGPRDVAADAAAALQIRPTADRHGAFWTKTQIRRATALPTVR